MRRAIAAVLVAGMAVSPAGVPVTAVAQQSNGNSGYTLQVNVQRVLTNVVVRDKKTGELIKGLKIGDFTVTEDKKPQKLISVDFENVDDVAVAALAEKATVTGTAGAKKSIADLVNNDFAATPEEYKDRRMIVMFFDLSSMQPEDITRAVDSAKDYIANHILKPLGMNHSTFQQPLPASLAPFMSNGYTKASAEKPTPFESIETAPAGAMSATGGWYSPNSTSRCASRSSARCGTPCFFR